jgi:hypothetical protein
MRLHRHKRGEAVNINALKCDKDPGEGVPITFHTILFGDRLTDMERGGIEVRRRESGVPLEAVAASGGD